MSAAPNEQAEAAWQRSAARIGVPTLLATAVLCLAPNLILYLQYGAFPTWDVALAGWGMVLASFGAFYVVEPISYFPVLGLVGTYMSFLAGNVANMRLPCSAIAQEAAGVEPDTPEAEIVSALGIAGSIITSLLFLIVGAAAGYGLLRHFPPPLQTAFVNYTSPAIFGAVFGQFARRHPTIAIAALAITVPLKMVFRVPDWIVIVVAVFGTIAVARLLYVKRAT
ncbi:MAG: hypothetical protein ABSF26_04185 [Thermoguttaceae bacterium]